MQSYSGLMFLLIALVSGAFGFSGGDATVGAVAQLVFVAALILSAVSLLIGAARVNDRDFGLK